MDDLISRQAAIRAYCEHECGKGMIRGECGCDDCGTIFDGLPSAQPEIIRCKDCKYSSPNKVYGCRIHSFADDLDERMYADDFCSFAERRTDETD